jgi:hypothetical protein
VRRARRPRDGLGEDLDVLDPRDAPRMSALGSTSSAVDQASLPSEIKAVPARRKLRSAVVRSGIAALCAAVGGVVGWHLRPDHDQRQTQGLVLPLPTTSLPTVPDVSGLSPWDAEALLARFGLASSVSERDPLTQTSQVFAQEPGAGEVAPVGSIVSLRTQDTRPETNSTRYLCTYGIDEAHFSADGLPNVTAATTDRTKVDKVWRANQFRLRTSLPHVTAVTVGPGFRLAWKGKNGGPYEVIYVRDYAILLHLASVKDCPRGKRPLASVDGAPLFYTYG